jgi:transposase
LHVHYVRPYVRRNKTDAADADALLRARRDADPKPVPVKPVDQQALQGLHRIRQQWVATHTQRINLARGLLAELGISLPAGAAGIVRRLHESIDRVPSVLVAALTPILNGSARSSSRSSPSIDNSARSPKPVQMSNG